MSIYIGKINVYKVHLYCIELVISLESTLKYIFFSTIKSIPLHRQLNELTFGIKLNSTMHIHIPAM